MTSTWTVSRIPLLVYVTGILMREGVGHDYVWVIQDDGVELRFNRALLRNDFVTVVDTWHHASYVYDGHHASGVYRMPKAFSTLWLPILSRPIKSAEVEPA